MQKEEQMRQLRETTTQLQRMVTQLTAQNKRKEDIESAKTVDEEIHDGGGATDEQMRAKDEQLKKLQLELERMQNQVDEDLDEQSFEQGSPGKRPAAYDAENQSGQRGKGGKKGGREERRASSAGTVELDAALAQSKQQLLHVDAAKRALQQRLEGSEARANAASAQAAQSEAALRQKESEIMQLIKARDELASKANTHVTSREEELGELNDSLYEANTRADEAEEAKAEIEAEMVQVRADADKARDAARKHEARVRELQQELEEAVEDKNRAERLLSAAMPS